MGNRAIGMLLLGAFAGCGGGGAGGTLKFMTTLPATTPLGQITFAQLPTICGDIDGYRGQLASDATFRPVLCKYAGIQAAASTVGPNATDAQVQQACITAASTCESAPPRPFALLGCSVTPPATCTATVAQYAACLEDSVAAAEASVATIPTCTSLTVATLRASGGTTGTPPPPVSCVTFESACPGSGGIGDLPPPFISPGTLAPTP
jgi:hypothetical protein